MKLLTLYQPLRFTAAGLALCAFIGAPPAALAENTPPLAAFIDPTDALSPSLEELEDRFTALAEAGIAEIEEALDELGTSPGFSQRLQAALEVDRSRTAGRSEPFEVNADTLRLLDLIASAETYSEAKLLAQVASGAGRRIETPKLSDVSDNPDWVFDGYNIQLPELVSLGLETRREARDERLDSLSDEAFHEYAAAVEAAHRAQRAIVTMTAGREADLRPDLYVVELENREIWRRKMPSRETLSTVDQGEPGGDSSLEATRFEPNEEATGSVPGTAVIGPDTRQLRSRFNGHNMNSVAWKPKGAILSRSANPNATPIEVRCTGVKITERLVATAGHCLFKNGSWNSNRRWVPGADGIAVAMGLTSDPSPFGYKSSYRRIVRSQWKDHEWRNFDFGLMVLYDNASSCRLPWHGWKRQGGLLHDRVHLYGFPGERQDCAASPLPTADCYGSIYGSSGRILHAGAFRLHYKIDTQPGQSGTGFYRILDAGRYVVGVHRGPFNRYRNDGVRINRGVRNIINRAKSDYPPKACR